MIGAVSSVFVSTVQLVQLVQFSSEFQLRITQALMESFGLATVEDWHVGGQALKVWGQKVGESEVRGINRKFESKYRVHFVHRECQERGFRG